MNLEQALRRKGVSTRTNTRGEVILCCPFCPERGESVDTRFRLQIDPKRNWGHCFNCNWGSRGSAIEVLLRKLKVSSEGIQLESSEVNISVPQKVRLPEDFQLLTKVYSDLDLQATEYLRSRGILPSQIRSKKIGVSYIGRYAYRIIFPVFRNRHLTGFVGRDFTGRQDPKYLNSVGQKSLYNAKPNRSYIISEGVFKCLRIEQAIQGSQSVASLGRTLTEEQIDQLKEMQVEEVTLWPDPDRSGRVGVHETASILCSYFAKVNIVWPVQIPADEAALKHLTEAFATRLPFTWRVATHLLKGV